jgi:hypothetical protein
MLSNLFCDAMQSTYVRREGAEKFTDRTPKPARLEYRLELYSTLFKRSFCDLIFLRPHHRDLISLMLHPDGHKRGGYTDMKRVFSMPYFEVPPTNTTLIVYRCLCLDPRNRHDHSTLPFPAHPRPCLTF